jgi:hypothetical protein
VDPDRSFGLLVTLAICLPVYCITLLFPYGSDNAFWAYVTDLGLKGFVVYRDVAEQNYPGIMLVHLVPLLVGAKSAVAFRVWDIMLQLFGIIWLFRLGEQWHSRKAGFLISVLVAMYYAIMGNENVAGQRDVYAGLLLVGALYYLTKQNRHTTTAALLLGLAIVFRPLYGIHAAVALAIISFYRKPFCVSQFLKLGFTVATPLIAMLLLFAVLGALDDFYEMTFAFTTQVYNQYNSWSTALAPFRLTVVFLLPAIAGLIFLVKGDHFKALLITGLFAAQLISLLLLWRYNYHYYPAILIIAILSGIGLSVVVNQIRNIFFRRVAIALLLLMTFFFGFRGTTHKMAWSKVLTGQISITQASHLYDDDPGIGLKVKNDVVDYLRSRTPPNDYIQTFWTSFYIPLLADARPASRFIAWTQLIMRPKSGKLTDFQLRWREEYRSDLERKKPYFFVTFDGGKLDGYSANGLSPEETLRLDLVEVGKWLEENYRVDTTIGSFKIYRRMAPR